MNPIALRRLAMVLTCGAMLLCASMAHGQAKLWGRLQPGEFGVGFKSWWISDPSRTYTYKFADGTRYDENRPARPILVNLWYPAKPDASRPYIREGDYLDFDPADGSLLSRYARDLIAQNKAVISNDVLGKPLKDLDTLGKAALEAFLGTETTAIRNAIPASGPFPLAIYIQGYGSSLQDNSALCEYLASHGYVVLGSAFQDEEGDMIAGRNTTVADVGCLVKVARELPQVDISKVALIGHSGGAQSSMVYASREGAVIDAVVSLDTTQDYYFNDKSGFKGYLEDVDRRNFKVPLLAVAGRSAIFDFVDTLDNSDRLYLTVDRLGHEEYTCQGFAAAIYQKKSNEEDVRQRYTSLCEFVVKFLNAKLNGASASNLHTPPAHFALEEAPSGTNGPKPYEPGALLPTPRQLRVLVEKSVRTALRFYELPAKAKSDSPIYEGQLAFAILDHLLERNDVGSAKRFVKMARRPESKATWGVDIYLAWGRIYENNGSRLEAIRSYEKVLMLDPRSQEAKARIAKLKAGSP